MKLRLQEFIELVRENKLMEAITYSRKYLSTYSETNMKDIQMVMVTLAFSNNIADNSKIGKYKVLFIIITIIITIIIC